MRPIRVIGALTLFYNFAAVTALLVLSGGEVYALAIMAVVLASVILISQLTLRSMLMGAR